METINLNLGIPEEIQSIVKFRINWILRIGEIGMQITCVNVKWAYSTQQDLRRKTSFTADGKCLPIFKFYDNMNYTLNSN